MQFCPVNIPVQIRHMHWEKLGPLISCRRRSAAASGVSQQHSAELSCVFIIYFSSFLPFPKSKIYPSASPSDWGPQEEEVAAVGGASRQGAERGRRLLRRPSPPPLTPRMGRRPLPVDFDNRCQTLANVPLIQIPECSAGSLADFLL